MKPLIYTSDDYGSPQLKGNWGDLVKMLKTVLVDGFGDVVGSIARRVDPNSLQITLGFEVNLQVEGVIYIKDVVGHENTRFHIKSRPSAGVVIVKNYDNVDLSAFADNDVVCTVTRKPLGYTMLFDDITNSGKAVFTNRNGWNLRVHDAFPTENAIWQSTWAKGARISYGREMVNIDTWTTQPKNYNPSRPDSWKVPHHVGTVSNGNVKLSENVWLYCTARDSLSSYVYSTTESNNTTNVYSWTIIGTDTTFYLYINCAQYQYYPIAQHCYGFGEFDSLIANDINNAFLISWVSPGSSYIFNTESMFRWATQMNSNTNQDDYSYKQLNLASPSSQASSPNYIPYASLTWLRYSGLGTPISGQSPSFYQANGDIASIMYSPAYIDEVGYLLRGTMKGAHIILNDVRQIVRGVLYNGQFLTVNAYNPGSNTDDKKYILKPHINYYSSPDSSLSAIMFNLYEEW